MKKINNELKQIVKKIEGKILLIGEYPIEINNILLANENVCLCEQLTYKNNKLTTNEKTNKIKKVNIRKIRKRYKKNGIDHLFVDEQQINEFKNTFIKDSVYIVKNRIYLVKSKESEQIIKMYSRYSKKIDTIECLDGQLVCIDVTNCKTNKIKDTWFYIVDCLIELINIIGDILIN